MTAEEFRWLPYAGRRHAIRRALAAGEAGMTLCCVEVVVPRDPPPKYPDGCWPTCHVCDAEWRKVQGIPAFPFPRRAGDGQGEPSVDPERVGGGT
ncbi:zinc finger protein [Saccharothrix variisporea]|uniref:Zinc finger protein n=1 Tax=Saccharothrix variisporea TaxID=543527 RepID=A0A495X9C1_9PSEU|nr:zinc finger protein [Saccharothrix variisporea]RKT69464.1 zinc finger protein [Saccharothrix variisporea]